MKILWKTGLDVQQVKDLEQRYKEASFVRNRLEVLLREIIEQKRAGAVAERLYDSPNWAYLQADRAGYERALRDIISLIED